MFSSISFYYKTGIELVFRPVDRNVNITNARNNFIAETQTSCGFTGNVFPAKWNLGLPPLSFSARLFYYINLEIKFPAVVMRRETILLSAPLYFILIKSLPSATAWATPCCHGDRTLL